MSTNLDLTKEEQRHVRGALQFLRRRVGSWRQLAKALHMVERTLTNMSHPSGKTITPLVAFRAARFAKVSMDDLLAGNFPAPGTCPYCGHVSPDGKVAWEDDEPT